MSDNMFSFPGESTGQDAGDFFGGAGGVAFTDLGSADGAENPFANMMPPAEESAPGQQTQQAQDQPGTTQTPPPAAPPAAPAPAETPKTPPAQTTEEANPLMAAMDLQEKKNAAKAAAPIFAQLPVFSYNGSQEPIENIDQTFEELRLAKADDFPEFDEAQSVSWTVTYGKIVKNVATPRKTKIGNLKREIESSKEFMDALKKAADKRPKCIVKPKVTMQKKGECAYKGIFPRLADERASEKTISFIPAQDGRVYERGHIAPHLYRLLYALERPVQFVICDGDVVEEKNLVRQNFTKADLGLNKARVVAERYSNVFGLETSYVPDFIESAEKLEELITPRSWPLRSGLLYCQTG